MFLDSCTNITMIKKFNYPDTLKCVTKQELQVEFVEYDNTKFIFNNCTRDNENCVYIFTSCNKSLNSYLEADNQINNHWKYTPCFVMKNDKIDIIQKYGDEFQYDTDLIKKTKFIKNKYDKFRLRIKNTWKNCNIISQIFEFDFNMYNPAKLKAKLENFSNNNFQLSILEFKKTSQNLIIENNCLSISYNIKVQCKISGSFFTTREEVLDFEFNNENTSEAANNNDNDNDNESHQNIKTLKLEAIFPYLDYAHFTQDQKYNENDIVIYKDALYKCINTNQSPIFDAANWNMIDQISPSYSEAIRSTECFQNFFNFVKSTANCVLEKYMSDQIEISLYIGNNIGGNILPQLNDFFVYQNEKYRIAELQLSYTKNSIKIIGWKFAKTDCGEIAFAEDEIATESIVDNIEAKLIPYNNTENNDQEEGNDQIKGNCMHIFLPDNNKIKFSLSKKIN